MATVATNRRSRGGEGGYLMESTSGAAIDAYAEERWSVERLCGGEILFRGWS